MLRGPVSIFLLLAASLLSLYKHPPDVPFLLRMSGKKTAAQIESGERHSWELWNRKPWRGAAPLLIPVSFSPSPVWVRSALPPRRPWPNTAFFRPSFPPLPPASPVRLTRCLPPRTSQRLRPISFHLALTPPPGYALPLIAQNMTPHTLAAPVASLALLLVGLDFAERAHAQSTQADGPSDQGECISTSVSPSCTILNSSE